MSTLVMLLVGYVDSTLAHAVVAAYLFAVLDERSWRRLKKLPALLLSPLINNSLSIFLMYALPGGNLIRFWATSLCAMLCVVLWARWAWRMGFWQALSAVSMTGVFQVSLVILTRFLCRNIFVDNEILQFAAVTAIVCVVVALSTALLYRLRFGRWFRLLLEEGSGQRRTALFLFTLACVMEMFYMLQVVGLQEEYFALYYLLVLVTVVLVTRLVLYLAHWFDSARKMEAQRDVIAQQQLYERDLEDIRREVRSFRHDYKNLLAGLSEQADEGELDQLRAALSELDAGFDRRIGEKIRASTQIGSLRVPQVRSLLLSKLAAMGGQGIDCRLEVLSPWRRWGWTCGTLCAVWAFCWTTPPRPLWRRRRPGWRWSCWHKRIRCPCGCPTPTPGPSTRTKSGRRAFPPRGRAGGWASPATSGFWRSTPIRPRPPAGRGACLFRS